MPFSSLSREVRDLIYHALLCPPDGVQLHCDHKRWMRKIAAAKTTSHGTHGYNHTGNEADEHDDDLREENGEEEDSKDIDQWGNSNSPAAVVTPVPTAIFYVNRQIRQEAIEVFYRFNRFTFDNEVRTAFKFLKGLRPSSRRRIRDIGFARRSTLSDNYDSKESWALISSFIARHMYLHSVTLRVPYDINCETDRTKEVIPVVDRERYYWPAVRLMGSLLMAGKIEKLRIGYCATLKIRASEEEKAQDMTAGQSQHKSPLEILTSVSYLRYLRPQDERNREFHEIMDFLRARDQKRSYNFPSLNALEADHMRRRQRFNFVVNQEDDPIGDVGTVLVLARPAAS